jgi:hypothetical protein
MAGNSAIDFLRPKGSDEISFGKIKQAEVAK